MPLSGAGRKRKGARRELQAVKLLEHNGYLVTKAGGSLGAFDIIAVGKTHDRLIQVKSNRPPGKTERDNLVELADILRTDWRTVELWIFKDGIKMPFIYFITPKGFPNKKDWWLKV